MRQKKAKRVHDTYTYTIEKKTLDYLVKKLPSWVTPDHLTLLGLIAAFLAGACYFLAKYNPLFLFAASFFLIVNWYGDSLDGTLARYRKHTRKKYGYYVDHISDAFAILFIVLGISFSGFMHPTIGLGILLAYYIAAINSYLIAYTRGLFFISYEKFGPTELRILLILFNTASFIVATRGDFLFYGVKIYMLDIMGVILLLAVLQLLLVNIFKNLKHLNAEDK